LLHGHRLFTGTPTSAQTVVAPARVSAIQRPWTSSRLARPETGARFLRKKVKATSIRPSCACSSSSICAWRRRSTAASSGSVFCSSQATKRDMCVPFCSAGKTTSSVQVPVAGCTAPATRSCSG